ncbi:MAG: Dyp-type peroxidase family [Nocardioides sp.]|nr:Dyp-type peroxidase family [Nocardioides sp.]
MNLPQPGIFALGTPAHTYLEFELLDPGAATALVSAVANLTQTRTTMGGVNMVTGFRPELWRAVAPGQLPEDLHDFVEPVEGTEGFSMPATQRDVMIWIAGGSHDVVFDAAIEAIAALEGRADLVEEILGWTYHRDLDLTGFIDGTENDPLLVAPQNVLVPRGSPGAGGSVLLLQKWVHDAVSWSLLSQHQQELAMGRTKADSTELEGKPLSSHVARTDQDEFGKIFRRNTPYGWVREHGTVFVGFAAEQRPLARMLDSMAGVTGVRDDLTRYATPLTGSYYFVPASDDLLAHATDVD